MFTVLEIILITLPHPLIKKKKKEKNTQKLSSVPSAFVAIVSLSHVVGQQHHIALFHMSGSH